MTLALVRMDKSSDGSTKFLWQLDDGAGSVESIYFPLNGQNIYCLSSQVGCNVGCPFCETGKQKALRNLNSDEILGQVYGALNALGIDKIDEIDYAGMGEPLHNFSAIKESSKRMIEENLTDLVSLTTSGIVPELAKIHQTEVGEVYISLHASCNEIRNKLVPVNKKWPIETLVKASRLVSEHLNKKITANYLLFSGLNDADECPDQLTKILDPIHFRVQLAEWNEVTDARFITAPKSRFQFFYDRLVTAGFEVIFMKSKGIDVFGGCGQLRSAYQKS